jgi:hypothetical protein
MAFEAAGVRALQYGPIGHGYILADQPSSEFEFYFGLRRGHGSQLSNGQRLSSTTDQKEVSLGAGFRISQEVSFQLFNINRFFQFESRAPSTIAYRGNIESRTSEIGAGPFILSHPWILGAYISVLSYGEEYREFEANGISTRHQIGSAAMPLFNGYLALSTNRYRASLGLRTFNTVRVGVTSKDGTTNTYSYDSARKSPAELKLDLQIPFSTTVTLGTSVTYLKTGQASRGVDEFDLTDLRQGRLKGSPGEALHRDHLKFSAGGVLKAQPWIHFTGAVHSIQSSYADKQWASLETENIGRTRVDVGMVYFQPIGKIFFNIAYAETGSPLTVTHQKTRSEDWLESGGTSKFDQHFWDGVLGVAFFM